MARYCLEVKERLARYGNACLPSVGGISLVTLSSTIMEKQFLRSYFGDVQPLVKDALWWYSHAGVGTWIYQRKHLSSVGAVSRVTISAAGSLVFNQGVMLLLAMFRLRLPDCRYVTIPLGVGACFGLVHMGRVYGHHCDALADKALATSAATSAAAAPPASSTAAVSSSPPLSKSASPRKRCSTPQKSESPTPEPESIENENSLNLSMVEPSLG